MSEEDEHEKENADVPECDEDPEDLEAAQKLAQPISRRRLGDDKRVRTLLPLEVEVEHGGCVHHQRPEQYQVRDHCQLRNYLLKHQWPESLLNLCYRILFPTLVFSINLVELYLI